MSAISHFRNLEDLEDFEDPQLHQEAEEGLPWESAEILKKKLDLSDDELATILGRNTRTITRKRKDDKELSTEESDRLFRALRVFLRAKGIFDDDSAARSWLKREQTSLGESVPIAMLTTDAGTRSVEKALGNIEHGIVL